MAFSSEYILTVCAGVAVNGKTILLLRLRCLVLVLGELFNLCFVAGGTAVKWAVIAILFDSVLYWFIGVVLGLFCLDIWLICPKISLDIWTFGGRFGYNIIHPIILPFIIYYYRLSIYH